MELASVKGFIKGSAKSQSKGNKSKRSRPNHTIGGERPAPTGAAEVVSSLKCLIL